MYLEDDLLDPGLKLFVDDEKLLVIEGRVFGPLIVLESVERLPSCLSCTKKKENKRYIFWHFFLSGKKADAFDRIYLLVSF